MAKPSPPRWRGLLDLAHDLIDGTTQLIEDTEDQVGEQVVAYLSLVDGLGAPAARVEQVRRTLAHLVTGSVKGVNHLVRGAVAAGAELAPEEEEVPPPLRADAKRFRADLALGVLNGSVGDHLRERGNPLDLGLKLRFEDRYFEPEDGASVLPDMAEAKVCVFVHGLFATETYWALGAEEAWGTPEVNYATRLAADRGYVPIFVRYNTGVHISDNGQALAEAMAALAASYPAMRELVLIGHSLGGLVARSATHRASTSEAAWLDILRAVITLGTPHEGSPIAEGAGFVTSGLGAVDLPATQVLAKIARRRSAAIKDLRKGYLVQEDWHGRDVDAWLAAPRTEVAFVDGVTYLFLGSTLTQDPEAPVGRAVGDLLVHLPSATHEAASFEIDRRVVGGLHHMVLQADRGVYGQIRDFLA